MPSGLVVRTVKKWLPPGVLYRVEIRSKADFARCNARGSYELPERLGFYSNRSMDAWVDFDGVRREVKPVRVSNFMTLKKTQAADFIRLACGVWYAVGGDELVRIDGEPVRAFVVRG